MKTILLLLFQAIVLVSTITYSKERIYDVSQFGLQSNNDQNASPIIKKVLMRIKSDYKDGDSIKLMFPKGKYYFHEEGAFVREYYISNHDQSNSKKVGIALENMKNFILDGQGSEFIFYGRMIPLSLLHSENCVLKNLSIDFENPHIAQIYIRENNPVTGITFEVAPWVKYRIIEDSVFETYGEGWTLRPSFGIQYK